MKRVFASENSALVRVRSSILEAAHVAFEFRPRDSYSELFSPSTGADELWVEDQDYDEAVGLLQNAPALTRSSGTLSDPIGEDRGEGTPP
jgi:hypothetical protein